MKEIGGYFGLEDFVSNEYYKDLTPLNSARNALLYILKTKNVKKIYIPYFLCDVISNMLIKNKVQFKHYYIDTGFQPLLDEKVHDDEYVYIVNYYGQFSNEKINDLKCEYKRIILDNTHSFFQYPLKDVDTIYSCRKYFGVPDGAYLSTNTKLNENLCQDVSKERMVHILGRYEGKATEYYDDFQRNDLSLSDEPIKYMSKLTHNILGAIDYKNIIKSRNRNFNYLQENLSIYNKLKLIMPEGAFAYPFYIKDGIKVREELSKMKIYIPILWPNVLRNMKSSTIEYEYASNILPIPCDQRYTIDDMDIIIKSLFELKKQSNQSKEKVRC